MLPTSAAVKSTAKTSLKNQWPQAVAVGLIVLSTYFCSMMIEQFFLTALKADFHWSSFNIFDLFDLTTPPRILTTIFTFAFGMLVVSPLSLGAFRWFWRATGGAKDSVAEVFHFFSSFQNYSKSIAIYIGYGWRFMLTLLVLQAPAILMKSAHLIFGVKYFGIAAINEKIFVQIYSVMAVIATVVAIIYMLRYLFAPVLIFAHEDLSVNDAYKYSARLSKGVKAPFVGFLLTFIGWLILSFIALPLIFVVPYFMASTAVFMRFAINHYALSHGANIL